MNTHNPPSYQYVPPDSAPPGAGVGGDKRGSTIRLVTTDPTTSDSNPYSSHIPSGPSHDPYSGMSSAEANYWKSRPNEYNDPYESHAPGGGGGGGGAGSPYVNNAAAQSEPTIGPWDSASQRSIPYASFPMPAPTAAPLSDNSSHAGQGQGHGHLRNKPSTLTAGGLSYIDEEGGYHRSPHNRPASYVGGMSTQKEDPYGEEEHEMRGLVTNAADMGRGPGSGQRGMDGTGGGYGYGYGNGNGNELDYNGNGKYNNPNNPNGNNPYDTSPYAWPDLDNVNANAHLRKESKMMSLLLFPTGLDRLLALFGMNKGSFPIEQQIERKKHGVTGQRYPVATWALTAGEFLISLHTFELALGEIRMGFPLDPVRTDFPRARLFLKSSAD